MSMLARLATTGGATQTYVDDVFSTYLYTGNGSTQTITNGIDLAGKGGLVWSKDRGFSAGQVWYDTARGAYPTASYINSASTEAASLANGGAFANITGFNSNGYTIGSTSSTNIINYSGSPYVSWTFRRAPKFFDVVTYTGNGAGSRSISHNLGTEPGMIVVKRTDNTSNWMVWHRSISGQNNLYLNTTDGTSTVAADPISVPGWPSAPSTTVFDVASGTDSCNTNGASYVAYLFAHDTSTDGLIQCGSYTLDASGNADINLGFEPQFIISKRANGSGSWVNIDSMRGFSLGGSAFLLPNTSGAEGAYGANVVFPTASGFSLRGWGASGSQEIYLAIRRPNKPPTSGTQVFTPVQASAGTQTTGFPIDTQIYAWTTRSTDDNYVIDRLRGVSTSTSSDIGPQLKTNKLDSESNSTNYAKNWTNQSFDVPLNYVTLPTVYWNFRRAPGFFDVVCYTGNGVSNTSYTHNLSAIPELAFIKRRNTTGEWWVCRMNPTTVDTAQLQSTAAFTLGTTYGGSSIMKAAPTSTTFNLGNYADVNAAGGTYVAYLFASLPGISKVGSYTGNGGTVNTNGTSQTINCGFTGGARFVLVKRTDSTGNWYVFDTARGIVAASDPYLLLNSTAAEVTTVDAVDTNNSGFIVNQTSGTNLNVTNATYIYLAIA